MSAKIVSGIVRIENKTYLANMVLRTENDGEHTKLSLTTDDDGLMMHICCDDPAIKQMLKEIIEDE